MPVQTCKEKGKSGKKYGRHGKCYTGKDKEKKAQKQAVAIKISQGKIKPKGGKRRGR